MNRFVPFITLFASFGTLICCALPALMVTLGLGATLAATVSAVPQLIWISENKSLVFGFAGIMIVLGFVVSKYGEAQSCPIDPDQAKACATGKRISRWILIFSAVVYSIGAFFAFIAPVLF